MHLSDFCSLCRHHSFTVTAVVKDQLFAYDVWLYYLKFLYIFG